MNRTLLLSFVIFISSYLLFQLELIVAKIFLPNFGGSYMIWGACMVFFQTILLLGYFSVWIIYRKFGIRVLQIIYFIVLIASVFSFPFKKIELIFEQLNTGNLALDVFLELAKTIGIVFFALSMTSVLCQYWMHGIKKDEKVNVYGLFAISNAGSFVALISYPFFFEKYTNLFLQQQLWSVIFYVFLGLYVFTFMLLKVPKAKIKPSKNTIQKTSGKLVFQWLLYSAGGVVLFLAITNILTQTIVPMPLLWVLPLAIYLLSYIIVFSGKFRSAFILRIVIYTIPVALTYYFLSTINSFSKTFDILFYTVLLTIMSLFFQIKLFEKKPENNNLGIFYIYMGLGGLIGGLIVIWLLPLVSINHFEYFLALIIVTLSLFKKIQVDKKAIKYLATIFIVFGFFLIPKIFSSALIWGALLLIFAMLYMCSKPYYKSFQIVLVVILISFLSPLIEASWENKNYILKHRNHYGVSKIYDTKTARFLVNGGIIHGGQILKDKTGKIPLVYYHPNSPSAEIIKKFDGLKKMAIVGLGSGALASYCSDNQELDFYELDPYTKKMAYKYFSFIKNSKGKIEVILGDARKEMQKSNKKYDLIIIDAFSGDAVPTHLITKEALQLYEDLLTKNGILLMHLTNRYVNLKQVFVNTVNMEQNDCFYKLDTKSGSKLFRSEWIAVINKKSSPFSFDFNKNEWSHININKSHPNKAWTDNYNYILDYVEYENLF